VNADDIAERLALAWDPDPDRHDPDEWTSDDEDPQP
jgi:hypothetical protein